MRSRDFDEQFEAMGRRIERSRRVNAAVGIAAFAIVAVVLLWLLLHPEQIGAFFGRVVRGFEGDAL